MLELVCDVLLNYIDDFCALQANLTALLRTAEQINGLTNIKSLSKVFFHQKPPQQYQTSLP